MNCCKTGVEENKKNCQFNPTALRKAKIVHVYNFCLSECNRVKESCRVVYTESVPLHHNFLKYISLYGLERGIIPS